jgi:Na+-driven multidrug efflux pump
MRQLLVLNLVLNIVLIVLVVFLAEELFNDMMNAKSQITDTIFAFWKDYEKGLQPCP